MKQCLQLRHLELHHTSRFVLKFFLNLVPKAPNALLCNKFRQLLHDKSKKEKNSFWNNLIIFFTIWSPYLYLKQVHFEIGWILDICHNERIQIHWILVAPEWQNVSFSVISSFIFFPFFIFTLFFVLTFFIIWSSCIASALICIVIIRRHDFTKELEKQISFSLFPLYDTRKISIFVTRSYKEVFMFVSRLFYYVPIGQQI